MDDKQKARLAAIGAAAILFIDWGLQVSGLQNIWTAIFLWGIAALLGIYWLKAVTTHSALARKLIAIALMFCACAAWYARRPERIRLLSDQLLDGRIRTSQSAI